MRLNMIDPLTVTAAENQARTTEQNGDENETVLQLKLMGREVRNHNKNC